MQAFNTVERMRSTKNHTVDLLRLPRRSEFRAKISTSPRVKEGSSGFLFWTRKSVVECPRGAFQEKPPIPYSETGGKQCAKRDLLLRERTGPAKRCVEVKHTKDKPIFQLVVAPLFSALFPGLRSNQSAQELGNDEG